MLEFLLYVFLTYIVGYIITTKFCKKLSLFNYINCKTYRRVVSVFVIFGTYILTSILFNRFNVSENIEKMFLWFGMGIMVALLVQIKQS